MVNHSSLSTLQNNCVQQFLKQDSEYNEKPE